MRTWLPGVSGGQEAIVDEFVSQLETGDWWVHAAHQLAGDCRLLTPFVPLSGAMGLNVSIRRNSWLSQLISQFQRLFLIQLIAAEVVTAMCSVVVVAPDVYPDPRNVPSCLLRCHVVCHYTSGH